jgi:tetratricopeptide (TPR) repeat protein
MESKLSQWCEGLIEAGWLAAVVATPLFFNIHSSRVFEPDKLTLLRSIALLMSVAWLIKFIDRQEWRSLDWLRWRSENSIWRMPFVLPVLLLVVVYLLSTLFSITRSVSWAGSYQRLQGTYTTLSYIVVFALMIATMRSREQVSRLVTAVIVTSIPVSLYAMLQHFGLDPLPWGGNTQGRVAGHMGNSIFIAAYLIMVVPLTLARIVDAFTNILGDEELSIADIIRSSIYIFALAVQLIAIYWTRSRGPLLGLGISVYAFVLILLVTLRNARSDERRLTLVDAVRALLLVLAGTVLPLIVATNVLEGQLSPTASLGFFVGAVGLLVLVIFVLALAGRGWRWLWLSWLFVALTVAGILGLFNVSERAVEPYLDVPVAGETLSVLNEWKGIPEIGRFGRFLEADRGTGRVRVLIWEGVLDLIAPHDPLQTPDGNPDPFNFLRPVLGYGPESMYVAYNRFYPPELATVEARNASPDRSHNETFDALAITGLSGFLVWQLLYLSVFYYGFRWLGVVRTSRDRNILIALWIGGAIVAGAVATLLLDISFLGVALPFGTIVGLVLYLVYYALFARSAEGGQEVSPFDVNRLLMIALVTAVLAHYVEIHFGIAIAATRVLFFVYAGLMFMVGYYLPRMSAEPEAPPVKGRSRKRRRRRLPAVAEGWLSPVLTAAFVLALILGILGYNYVTFTLPPGESIDSIADVPSAGAIFSQSFFVNAGEGFVDSPFIFLVFVLTWALGTLAFLSELAKSGRLRFGAVSKLSNPGRQRSAGLIFAALVLLAAAGRFLLPSAEEVGLTRQLGDGLLVIWSGLCLLAAVRLFQGGASGRRTAGVIAMIGIVFSIPVIVAGGTLYGAVVALAGFTLLYLLWDSAWNDLLLPGAILAVVSIVVGLLYTYLHAAQVQGNILPPSGLTASTTEVQRRILEAGQSTGLLTGFYVFAFLVLVVTGLVIAWPKMRSIRVWATLAGNAALIVLIPIAIILIGSTNLRIIQADIVYKRADPWDKQAGRTRDPNLWDNAIGIYEHAIELAPVEDFYYLWLGRAYLERSSVTEAQDEQQSLLTTAENLLLEAQRINPLNTDHTANLARLNTRWAESSGGDERAQRISTAESFYESALTLSPNNSVIANEYARLAYVLQEDCSRSLEIYQRSKQTDPYFANTYFEQAEVFLACAGQASEEEQVAYLEGAAASLQDGLARRSGEARQWLQLAEIYVRLNQTEQALAAYAEAITRDDLPQWQIDFILAQRFLEAGDTVRALEFGQKALAQAPAESVEQIQQFVSAIE